MINLFKRNQPSVILIIAFIGIFLWMPLFVIKPEQVQAAYHFSGIIKSIYDFLGENYILKNIISLTLVFLISALLSMLNTHFLFINFRTQMPGYWFVLLTTPFAYVYDLLPILLATVCLVLALRKVFESYDKKKKSFELIDAGLLVTFGSLFYPPVLFLHLFLFGSLIVLRAYSWKEWMFVILGGLIPLAIVWCISYVFETPFQESYRDLVLNKGNIPSLLIGQKIFAEFLGLLIVLASLLMIRVFNLKKINSRRFFSSLLLLFLATIAISIFISRINFLIVAFVPLSYLVTHYFYLMKRTKAGRIILYIIFFASILSIFNTLFPTILEM